MIQYSLFDTLDSIKQTRSVDSADLFQAYLDCRASKRYKEDALRFEVDFEHNLYELKEEIESGTYTPRRCRAFIVDKPVRREIFAAEFRDRVVHHWIINKLNPIFEQHFIPNSYACRVGKGTHYGVRQVSDFIRTCSAGYSKDCYVMKLDIQGFFMSISRTLLIQKLDQFIRQCYIQADRDLVIDLIEKVTRINPAENCSIKGNMSKWQHLPRSKSIFYSKKDCGLPIGNLTSQVFANFYMHEFDLYVTNLLGLHFYGRYVDDIVLVHECKETLLRARSSIALYLNNELKLKLHPKKFYCQHFSKGVRFLGTVIKPYRIYAGNRVKGNYYYAIQRLNKASASGQLSARVQRDFMTTINSYLGHLSHYKTYRIRMLYLYTHVSQIYWRYFKVARDVSKVSIRKNTLSAKK